jgi:hypothetical protein
MLLDVMLLALDPVRLRAEYRLFQAKPKPMPEPVEEEEDLRAKIRCSMALSRALASRCISMLLLLDVFPIQGIVKYLSTAPFLISRCF